MHPQDPETAGEQNLLEDISPADNPLQQLALRINGGIFEQLIIRQILKGENPTLNLNGEEVELDPDFVKKVLENQQQDP